MAQTLTLPSPSASSARTRGQQFALAVAATGLVALSAHVSVPLFFTPVPFTLQPLAVVLLGLVLGPRLGFATLALYLAEGAAGLPVFSPHGPGGLAQLLGPTGGYLMAAPFAAGLAGLVAPPACRGLLRRLLGAALGNALLLAAGGTWLAVIAHLDVRTVLAQAVLPFLPGDALKVCLAAAAAASIAGLLRRRNHAQAEESAV